MISLMAIHPQTGKEQELEAESKIAALIHATAFIADGYTVKAWDTEAKAVVPLNGPLPLSFL
jgi:hypothetical protein